MSWILLNDGINVKTPGMPIPPLPWEVIMKGTLFRPLAPNSWSPAIKLGQSEFALPQHWALENLYRKYLKHG
jgi:hypothetical protein